MKSKQKFSGTSAAHAWRAFLTVVIMGVLSGCRMIPLTYPDYKAEQVVQDVRLPATLVLGKSYATLQAFEQDERNHIAKCEKILLKLADHYERMVKKQFPGEAADIAPVPGNSDPSAVPIHGWSANKQQYWEDMVRKIRWHRMRIEKAYTFYIAANPADWEAMNRLGEFFYENGNRRWAFYWWRKAMDSAPHAAELFCNMGKFYADAGEGLKAIQAFQKAIELDDSVADYHTRLGTVYFTARQAVQETESMDLPAIFQASQAEFEKAWKLEPANFERAKDCYQNYLTAKFFNLKPEDYEDKEMGAVDRCLAMNLTDDQRVEVLTHKGRLYRRRKQFENAYQALVEAVMLSDKQYAPALELLRQVERER